MPDKDVKERREVIIAAGATIQLITGAIMLAEFLAKQDSTSAVLVVLLLTVSATVFVLRWLR